MLFFLGTLLLGSVYLPRDSLVRFAYEKTYGGLTGLAVAQDSYPVRWRDEV